MVSRANCSPISASQRHCSKTAVSGSYYSAKETYALTEIAEGEAASPPHFSTHCNIRPRINK